MNIINRMTTFTFGQVRDAVDRALANETIINVGARRVARREVAERGAALRLKRAKEKA